MIRRISRQLAFFSKHPLTEQRPLAAAGRYLAWQLRSRLQQEVEFDWIEGSKLLVKRGMTGATGNIYCGLHEYADMAFLLHLLRPGDLFGDIGANIGSYTVLASAVCGSNVIAVEPDPGTAERLRLNVALNDGQKSVWVAETAVGDREGTISFTVGLDTMNKVSTAGDGATSRVVPLTTLDRLFAERTPTLLKLDVEGFEAAVLRGAEHVLSLPSLLAVQSESYEPEVLDTLKRHGFEQLHYAPQQRALTAECKVPHSNGLFVRNLPEVRQRIAGAPSRRVLDRLI